MSLESLRADVERLGRIIDAPENYLPTYGASEQSGRPHLEVTDDGLMHWVSRGART